MEVAREHSTNLEERLSSSVHARADIGVLGSFADLMIPDALSAAVVRHQKHVSDLVVGLRAVGMSDSVIDHSVDQLIASYRAELVRAIKALRDGRHV
jgi:hypothetical protein